MILTLCHFTTKFKKIKDARHYSESVTGPITEKAIVKRVICHRASVIYFFYFYSSSHLLSFILQFNRIIPIKKNGSSDSILRAEHWCQITFGRSRNVRFGFGNNRTSD